MIETHDLVCHLCELSGENEYEYDDLEQAIYDKYGVEFDQFDAIVRDLLPLIDVGRSGLTGKTYKGFSEQKDDFGFWLLKMEVSNEQNA